MITPFPDKKYSVIYADPPYQHDIETKDSMRKRHYPRMPVRDICDLDVASICESDAVLYLWATAPHTPTALEVMDSWGFDCKSQYVWVKDRIGMGYWVRSQHELLLIGKRGKFKTPIPSKRKSSVIHSPRRKHSQKPDIVIDMLNDLYLDLSKIELFARQRSVGWDAWGNELEDTLFTLQKGD